MTPNTFQKKRNEELTLERILAARDTLAKIITKYENGEIYLPIFKRLQKEIATYEEKENLMEEVKKIAKSLKNNTVL